MIIFLCLLITQLISSSPQRAGKLGNSSTASGSNDSGVTIDDLSFVHTVLLSIFGLLLAYFCFLVVFILAVPMRMCLGKHSFMRSTIPIAILNGTCYLGSSSLWCGSAIKLNNNELVFQPADWWRGVKPCELSEVARVLGTTRLRQIKQESGGLQTLLKNHRHIFRVEKGAVAFRVRYEFPYFLSRKKYFSSSSTCCNYFGCELFKNIKESIFFLQTSLFISFDCSLQAA